MNRERVRSSSLRAIGFDEATQTAEVEFHPDRSGKVVVWSYHPVSQAMYDSVVGNPSIGSAFDRIIKKNPHVQGMMIGKVDP